MKPSLLGKLFAFTGTGGSTCFFFGLTPDSSTKNREVLLTVDFKTETSKDKSKGKKFYQGMPLDGKICVTNKEVIGNSYELTLQSGRVKGGNSKNYSVKGAWGVYKHSSSSGGEIVKETDLDKFGLIALEFEKSIHFLLVADTNTEDTSKDKKSLDIKSEGIKGTAKTTETMVGRRISVSRDIVGYGTKKGSDGQCEKKIKGDQQLLRNFGNLHVDELPGYSVKVLDGVVGGESNIEKHWGIANFQKSTKLVTSGKSGFGTKQSPKNALIMKLSEATIDSEGIKDDAGNQIRGSSSIKPTITATLER